MSFRAALRQRHVLPLAAGTAASLALLQPRPAHAEEPSGGPEAVNMPRKPIYDDPEPTAPAPTAPAAAPAEEPASTSILSSLFGSSSSASESASTAPAQSTPTERLAVQVRAARLALYRGTSDAEAALNAFLTRTLSLERDFTATVASLAPPPQAHEPVVPGLVYVLVAALGGSIVTRNRGLLLRAGVPAAFGLTAAYAALPHTMRNVEALVARAEERYPRVQQAHRDVRDQTRHVWETGKAHTAMTVARGEEALAGARKRVEDWVRQGR